MTRPKALFLANDDAFFVSHRLELGLALRDAGFDVVVAAGEGGGRSAIEAGGLRYTAIPFDRGGRSIRRDAATLAAVMAIYAGERPSLVHHVTVKAVLYGSAAARWARVPAVVNAVSGLGFVFLDGSRRGRVLRAGIETAYRIALSHPNSATIFQNDDDRDHFVGRRLVDRDRARLIRGSGVDPDRFPVVPMPPDDPPVVLLPARLLRDKGVLEMVEAARRLRGAGLRARFVLVGAAGGTNPTAIDHSEVARWVEAGHVEWWGHRDDMPSVYAQAHLVVLPSYREGLPLALLEAAATGRACVTTDAPGCRDVVVDGETGWLVPPRSSSDLARAIAQALSDRRELERRGAAGAARVRREHTRQQIVAQHMNLYRELLGRAGR